MPNALPNPEGPLFSLDERQLEQGYRASRESPRKRIMLPVQRNQEAKVQRLLNFLQPGTYIRPHRHPRPHATESLCLISGHLELLIFTPDGAVRDRFPLTPSTPLIDLEPGIWHGMVVRQPNTVIFEVKHGPYDPSTDKEFATWSPPEGSPGVPDYLAGLISGEQGPA